MSRKAQLSVTVSEDVVADVDRGVDQGRFPSRSAAVELALRAWIRRHRDAEVREYYDGAPGTDLEESLEWAELGHQALTRRSSASPRRLTSHASGRNRRRKSGK